MLIDSFQRVAGFLFKALKFKDAEAFNEIYKILDCYEKFLTEDYFGGKQPGITDVNKLENDFLLLIILLNENIILFLVYDLAMV